MTVMVTGAAGLIGSNIVRTLLARDDTVIALDRDLATGRLDEPIADGTITALQADISDAAAVDAAVAENGVSHIIHTAAVLPPVSEDNPRLGFDINIGGTNNVFDAAVAHGVRRVVYPSSVSTYSDQSDYGDAVLDEESMQQPFSIYGVTKLANEFAARAYTRNAGLDCRGLRICTVFGHGRLTGRSAAASAMISSAAVGEPYRSAVTPDQTSAYIYVDDVAELMVRTAFAESLQRDVYCVGSNRASLNDVAATVHGFLPDADIIFEPDAAGFSQINRMSGARLDADLGYVMPPLADRIRDQINVARAERQLPLIS
jgi:nucleoside-diphosphate-sugar epimerase